MFSKKIIVYENITYFSVFSLLYYSLFSKYSIRYFSISKRFEKSRLFDCLNSSGHINKIEWSEFDYSVHMLSHDQSLNKIEEIYNEYFHQSIALNYLNSFFKTDKISLVYKKELTLRLQEFYEKSNQLAIIRKCYGGKLFFHPDIGHYCIKKLINDDINSEIHVSFSCKVFLFLYNTCKKTILLVALFFAPILLTLQQTRKLVRYKKPIKTYIAGFRIYKEDWAFLFKYRTVDFLIDNVKLTKDNTVFCIETDISQNYLNQLREKGYNLVDIRNDLNTITYGFLFEKVLKNAFLCSMKASLVSIFLPFYFIETTIGILFNYLRWSCFLENYNLKNYVLYTDFDKYHVVRNIMLNQSGATTWYYIHSIHHGDLFEKKEDVTKIRHVFYSYLFYNNIVSWGEVCRMIYERTQNFIENYMHVGCLWSEHVIMASGKNKNISEMLKIQKFENLDSVKYKVIGLFDTSFGKGVFIQLDDIISFLKGILLVLEKNLEILIIFKQKKEWDEMVYQLPEITGEFKLIYDKLLNHERFYSVGRLTDTCEVIAKSDLVVSACFTSTTSEALGARKKALFFDSGSNFRNCYFEKFPKMVAHGNDELEVFIHYWLYEITDEEFDDYLNKYVIGELDANLEGKGITKFRDLLVLEK